jgi:predicted aspartyl protease
MLFMEKTVGKVAAKFRMWNMLDGLSVLRGEKQTHEEECLVDTGAVMVVIPERTARALNLLREPSKLLVTFADGRREYREVAYGLRLETMGRKTECRAISEPGRDTVLIGQIALEDLDLLVNCKEQKLVPSDPSGAVTEVLAA